ncbi:hypothetical protein GOP47_0025454 [Adiantum capillus-veneris]|uniref:Uncharacterized protein n=1 Tax=Adiantum capillus-veneris TaxID=13818 RepID=A0A9D4U0M4_ADICA|nr:hypothetical protein GOP47_0025454 [Adiantum capillus-veneris]
MATSPVVMPAPPPSDPGLPPDLFLPSQPTSPSQFDFDTCNVDSDLLSVTFNQDYGCFACGTSKGFRIYNCEPFRETFHRDFPTGGIGMVEMLFRCNILALVGGAYPPNKVLIWDDHQNRCIGELSFRSETIANPRGLCCLSPSSNSAVLACLGLHRGQVRVEHYGLKKTKFISAHESHIACFALTMDGHLLATSSYKGTLIRVFNSIDGTRLREVRRGADRAEIYSICFSQNTQWLAVSSDKGTVHVFSLSAPGFSEVPRLPENAIKHSSSKENSGDFDSFDGRSASSPVAFSGSNPNSTLSFMKGVLPKYFSSEWSFAQFRLPEDVRTLVAFGTDANAVTIVGLDGSFYRCTFDPINGGEMQQHEFTRFFTADSYFMA